jgi:predicted nucleic acid-binding protein
LISLKKLKNTVCGKKVLIDSNIIIYLTDTIRPYDALSKELFAMIEEGKAEAVISILSVAEVMQGPIKAGKADIAIEVKNYLVNFPNCQCLNLTYDVLEKIGNDDRINWKALRSIDSLIIASGLNSEVDLFISNDRHFINALPAEILFSFET